MQRSYVAAQKVQPKTGVDIIEQQQYGTFKSSDLIIESSGSTKKSKPTSAAELSKFGQLTTDHMLEINYTTEEGWGAPRIVPYGKLSFHPAASSLHYGLMCNEGMNIYQNRDTK